MTQTVESWAPVIRSPRETARLGPTWWQYGLAAAATGALAAALAWTPSRAAGGLHDLLLIVFAAASVLRLALVAVRLSAPVATAPPLGDAALPAYTVIAPLYDEAAMVAGLVAALEALDYPRGRLQVVLALEADDRATREAAARAAARSALAIEVALSPPSGPRTKPKACNAALAHATGALVTVYDAEDRPEPGQLREAAARFAADASGRLGCLQAPLRITPSRGWLQRQFALEYGALFEVMLPAYARLGLPFPLGGTSNHFRREALSQAGGWDAWNVTEDADMGLRLAALGWRLGVLATPTWEDAPTALNVWTPQRTRWIKGHMQTWGVHMRTPFAGGWRRAAALQVTLGLSILSSLLHGALAAGVAACLVVAASAATWPAVSVWDVWLLFGGWASAVLALNAGARLRGERLRWRDAMSAIAYWPLQSLAAIFAMHQLVAKPFHWDKTPHTPAENGLSPTAIESCTEDTVDLEHQRARETI